MANDNVKIIINEVDETTPRGSGVSSDVAYIPGLAVDTMDGVQVYVLDEFGNKQIKKDENGNKLYDVQDYHYDVNQIDIKHVLE